MTSIPRPVPALPRAVNLSRGLPPAAALDWLQAGWRDLRTRPVPSLLYGLGVYLVSLNVIVGLFIFALDYVLLPALSAFMVIAPLLALGLYEKSRRLAAGEAIGLTDMVFVRPRAGAQVLFVGLLLSLLAVLWMRAAVLLYALHFGLQPYPGLDHAMAIVATTPMGWSLLLSGTFVGALFAAFAFAISALSLPMMLERRIDALTAMGRSMALVWNNLPALLSWGAIVLIGFLFCAASGLLGLIVIFPVIGHATWHAYQAIDPAA